MKKRKLNKIYEMNGKLFKTYKTMKTYAYYNIVVGEKKEAYELIDDEIYKIYKITKTERRLICEKIFDKEMEYELKMSKKQLKIEF